MSIPSRSVLIAIVAALGSSFFISRYLGSSFLKGSDNSSNDVNSLLADLQSTYTDNGQDHVFSYLYTLSDVEKHEFYNVMKDINIAHINKKFSELTQQQQALNIAPFNDHGLDLTSLGQIRNPSVANHAKALFNLGLQQISQGKLGVLLMAGGQGTRLGFDHPKGMFNLGLASNYTIFQYHAARLNKVRQLAATFSGKALEDIHIPWLIMTSDATHQDTLDYLRDNAFLNLPEDDVLLFKQGVLPALNLQGRIIMSDVGTPAMSPNGNGGLYSALRSIKPQLSKLNLDALHIVGVDNALVKIADPTMMGYLFSRNLDIVNKVIMKTDPSESVGVMAMKNGRPAIVEYSEIKEQSFARDENGELVYGEANIVNMMFSSSFIDKCMQHADDLPWHIANKQIPTYTITTDQTTKVSTKEKTKVAGIKMEMFMFDVFAWADEGKIKTLRVDRYTDFAPIKNADVAGKVVADSPLSSKQLLSQYHLSLLLNAGAKIYTQEGKRIAISDKHQVIAYTEPEVDEVVEVIVDLFDITGLVEIVPAVSYAGEGLEELVKDKSFTLPVYLL